MIVWLASYPKSGNTWVRSIIASLIYTNDGIFNFTLLEKIKQFPIADQFKHFTENVDDLNELKKYWIPAQDYLNLDNQIKFFKTHQLNCKINNYSFTNKKNTLATIYIVRDPRNLISSISNHYSLTEEEAKNFLLQPKILINKNKNIKKYKVSPVILGKWKEHYRFWKNNNHAFHLIKYEDLIYNPDYELDKIINFLKKFMEINTNPKKNQNILNTTNFNYLKSLEEKGQFNENAFSYEDNKKKFFHLGPENNWKNTLNNKIKLDIETELKDEMLELNYL